MINTYIFDLDDTLIDSTIYAKMYPALIKELVNIGVAETTIQQAINDLKEPDKKRVDTYKLCEQLGYIEVYYKVLALYVKHNYVLKTPELPKLFDKIIQSKKKIGVASHAQERTIQMFLDRYSMVVDFIASGDKLSTLFWVQLPKKYHIVPKESILVDDNEEILELAKHVGYKTMHVKDIGSILEFKL